MFFVLTTVHHRLSTYLGMCIKISPVLRIKKYWFDICSGKGPFKYYDIKEVGGWGGQMMMFDDKVGVAK
jgi:hypothetical protein